MPAQEKTITAAEANRKFSALLRSVREGNNYVVTSHGRPVAKIVAIDQVDEAAERRRRAKAFERLMKRLRSQPVLNLPRITRDEMHER